MISPIEDAHDIIAVATWRAEEHLLALERQVDANSPSPVHQRDDVHVRKYNARGVVKHISLRLGMVG